MSKIDDDLRKQLEQVLASGITEEATTKTRKKIADLACDLEEDLMWSLKDNLACNLAHWVADLAQRAVEQMLEGNDDQMRRYLSCEKRGEDGKYIGWTGRSDYKGYGAPRQLYEQHPVIHGRLFEQGAVALRKQIVDAHRDLLVNERIVDLEDQVKSLVEQVNRANAEKERMWERVRNNAA